MNFTQTSDCFNTCPAVGTKSDTSWTPPANTVCNGQTFPQIGDCGGNQTGTGGAAIIGGASSQEAAPIQELPDGGYIVAGDTETPGQFSIYVARLNHDGSLDSSFGTSGEASIGDPSVWQHGYSAIQTRDGGYAVAGDTSDNQTDMYVIKTNSRENYQ